MKTMFSPLLAGWLLAACALRANPPLSITVSPATMTNNYVGSILLSISNLSSAGATVRVDRILDVNSNGTIATNDVAVQSFFVTDGLEPLIGGVRNANVPGDDDGLANQTIQSHVPYPGVDLTLDHLAGQYIYRVTDLGSQATATAILDITQKVQPQGVMGQVLGPGGTPLAHAPVVASPQSGDDGFGTVSDGSGNFTLYAPPGVYGLFTVYAGQVANVVTVTNHSNAFASINPTNIASDGTTISGRVTDSVTSNGLPGVLVEATTISGLAVIGFTDANGAYSVQVTARGWTLRLGRGEGTILGYCEGPVTTITTNTSSGSLSNINFQLIKGNALVYGAVTTTQSNAAPSVTMTAGDANNSVFEGQGLTDANGNYSVVVVAGGDDVAPDGSDLTGFISPSTAFFTVSNGYAVRENFVLQPVTNQPSLSQPVLSGGQFQFQVTGNAGQSYRIDASTNLLANGWTPVYTNVGSFSFAGTVGTNRQLFFRAAAVP